MVAVAGPTLDSVATVVFLMVALPVAALPMAVVAVAVASAVAVAVSTPMAPQAVVAVETQPTSHSMQHRHLVNSCHWGQLTLAMATSR